MDYFLVFIVGIFIAWFACSNDKNVTVQGDDDSMFVVFKEQVYFLVGPIKGKEGQ